MYCHRMLKNEFTGLDYDDMKLEVFENLAARRKSRRDLALAIITNKIVVKDVTITTDKCETFKAVVWGDSDFVATIPETWNIDTNGVGFKAGYENVAGWMTMYENNNVLIMRADDDKILWRLERFMEPAVDFVLKEQAEAA